jgi:hypothetical protein
MTRSGEAATGRAYLSQDGRFGVGQNRSKANILAQRVALKAIER